MFKTNEIVSKGDVKIANALYAKTLPCFAEKKKKKCEELSHTKSCSHIIGKKYEHTQEPW